MKASKHGHWGTQLFARQNLFRGASVLHQHKTKRKSSDHPHDGFNESAGIAPTHRDLHSRVPRFEVHGTSGNPFSTAVAVSMIVRARCLNAPDTRRDFASECRIATSHASAAALWGRSALPARGEVKSSARGGFQRCPSANLESSHESNATMQQSSAHCGRSIGEKTSHCLLCAK